MGEQERAEGVAAELHDIDLVLVRKLAEVSQVEASVLAKVSPPTVRVFERFGPRAVRDPIKRERLTLLYRGWARGNAA